MAHATLEERLSLLEKTVRDLATRQDLEEVREHLREEIRRGDERTRLDLHALIEERTADIMSLVSTGNDETRRYMRVLYEDVIGRIARLHG